MGRSGASSAIAPRRLVLTFFGGEPLLNMPVLYYLSERLHARVRGMRGVRDAHQHHHQRAAADARDGRAAQPARSERHQDHARRRPRRAQPARAPLRGGQGTFDRIIANVRDRADLTRIAVGGNFDDRDASDTYPALLDFLAAQDFAPKLSKVDIQAGHPREDRALERDDSADRVVGVGGQSL